MRALCFTDRFISYVELYTTADPRTEQSLFGAIDRKTKKFQSKKNALVFHDFKILLFAPLLKRTKVAEERDFNIMTFLDIVKARAVRLKG